MTAKDCSRWLYVLGSVHEYRAGYAMAEPFYREALVVDPMNARAERALSREGGVERREDKTSDAPDLEALLNYDGADDSES